MKTNISQDFYTCVSVPLMILLHAYCVQNLDLVFARIIYHHVNMSKFSGKMCSCALHCSDIKKYEQNFSILKVVVLPGETQILLNTVFVFILLFCFVLTVRVLLCACYL